MLDFLLWQGSEPPPPTLPVLEKRMNKVNMYIMLIQISQSQNQFGLGFPLNQPIPPCHPMSSQCPLQFLNRPISAHGLCSIHQARRSFPPLSNLATWHLPWGPNALVEGHPGLEAVTEITNAAKNRNAEDIWYIYIWYDIWYMINYVMIYDDLCLKLIKYDVIITYNQNLVRWDRWVMIVPRQIWWTLAVCSQAEHGTSTSTLQYPAPICHVHLIELQVTEDSFVPRTTFALGHLSNASQSMKFIEISWPVSHYRDLCGGIHMRLYTVVIL